MAPIWVRERENRPPWRAIVLQLIAKRDGDKDDDQCEGDQDGDQNDDKDGDAGDQDDE